MTDKIFPVTTPPFGEPGLPHWPQSGDARTALDAILGFKCHRNDSNSWLMAGSVERYEEVETVQLVGWWHLDGRASTRRDRGQCRSCELVVSGRPVVDGNVDVVEPLWLMTMMMMDVALHRVDDVRHRLDQLTERRTQLAARVPARQHHVVPVVTHTWPRLHSMFRPQPHPQNLQSWPHGFAPDLTSTPTDFLWLGFTSSRRGRESRRPDERKFIRGYTRDSRIQTYAVPVPLKYGKLATKYP